MTEKTYSIPSKTGLALINVKLWLPDGEIKAIFQIFHGMAEHSERYKDFASFLNSNGFAVLINDHIGHGKSVKSDSELGYFGEKSGWDAFVVDGRDITELIKKEYPDIPIIMFGHSMGSFIVREYLRRYSRDARIKGAIICGTSGKVSANGIAIKLANTVIKISGTKSKSNLINKIAFGSYNKQIEKPKTEFDWLSSDENQVKKYIDDPLCGFLFSAAGYKDLFTILSKVSEDKWFKEVNPLLPILLVSGEDDPVGQYGVGVKEVYNKLIENGKKDVMMKLYPSMRHEILNEINNNLVYEDIFAWVKTKIGM